MRAPDLASIAAEAAKNATSRQNSGALYALASALEVWEAPTIDAETVLELCRASVIHGYNGHKVTGGTAITLFKRVVSAYTDRQGAPVDMPATQETSAATYFSTSLLLNTVYFLMPGYAQ